MKLIAFTDRFNEDIDNLSQIYLPCPRSNRRAVYFYNTKNQIFETQKVTGPGRKCCWVIEDSIYKDGSVRFISPIDALFLCLPILENAALDNRYRTLDDIFTRKNIKVEGQDGEMDIHRLSILVSVEQLVHLCDIKSVGTDVYRLNEKLVLDWLEKKVDRLMQNDSFQQSFEKTEQEQKYMKLDAVYTISSYLSNTWFYKLLKKLGIEELNGAQEVVLEDKVEEIVKDVSDSHIDYPSYMNQNPDDIPAPKRKDEEYEEKPVKKNKATVPKKFANAAKHTNPILNYFKRK